MSWNPQLYLSFAGPRFRPAVDLLAQVELDRPATVLDLGCGTGSAARLMKQRWPGARVIGVDGSREMLEKARAESVDVEWIEADLESWQPQEPADLIYSNAALHWLGNHDALFPRLLESLAPGGQLAVQMPRNYHAPGLRLINETALDGPWRDSLVSIIRPVPVAEPAVYYRLIAPRVARLNLWESEYQQVLEGDNPVADWTKSTWLSPLLAALEEPLRGTFEAEYRRRVAAAYPKEPDGRTLFPFRRLFFVATL